MLINGCEDRTHFTGSSSKETLHCGIDLNHWTHSTGTISKETLHCGIDLNKRCVLHIMLW